MAIQRKPILGLTQDAPASRRTAGSLRLAPTVKNDVFLKALLETPTTKHARRSPLEWLGAMGFHILIIAALIIVPLYTTGTIRLNPYEVTPLVAPPLAPAPAAAPVAPQAIHPKAKLTYKVQKLTPPTSIPRKVSSETAAEAAPDLGGLAAGVPGGVLGGQVGGARH
jgi:hypothetical protein